MVTAAEAEPPPEHAPPAVVMATGRPELAVAATLKPDPNPAVAGADWVTVMVWVRPDTTRFKVVDAPDAPLTNIGYVPNGVAAAVEIFRTAVQFGVQPLLVIEYVAPAGSPAAVRVSPAGLPATLVSVRVEVPKPPWTTLMSPLLASL